MTQQMTCYMATLAHGHFTAGVLCEDLVLREDSVLGKDFVLGEDSVLLQVLGRSSGVGV